MKTLCLALILCVVCFSFQGCMIVASPAAGAILTDVKAPITATSNTATYSKVGTAQCSSILGLVASGDASIEAAVKSAGITKISHVSYESKNILGIYGTFTTYVYGD